MYLFGPVSLTSVTNLCGVPGIAEFPGILDFQWGNQ